jgi:hypothetical protein
MIAILTALSSPGGRVVHPASKNPLRGWLAGTHGRIDRAATFQINRNSELRTHRG